VGKTKECCGKADADMMDGCALCAYVRAGCTAVAGVRAFANGKIEQSVTNSEKGAESHSALFLYSK
jgi:hypothetical protein